MTEILNRVNSGFAPPFLETETAMRITRLVGVCRKLEDIGLIIGNPGVGKTTTLKQIVSETPLALYCEMSPARSSPVGALTLICNRAGFPCSGRLRDIHEEFCNWVSWNRPSLLVVDEAQHLCDLAIDQLRCLHDETRVPLVLSGNASLKSRFNNTRQASFAQVTSRIGMKLELEQPTKKDMEVLAGHYGVKDGPAFKFLLKHTSVHGGLRLVSKLLFFAAEMAGGGQITLKHLEDSSVGMGWRI